MASKHKRTVGVVLTLVNILSNTNCQVLPENSRQQNQVSQSRLVPHLPGEHLLRGSSERHDLKRESSEMDIARIKFDETFRSNPEETPSALAEKYENAQDLERPLGFFNTEDGKPVQVEDGDLIVDPMTGQTMIRHIRPYQDSESVKESDYLIRPTDVALKNLQGFYVQNADIPPFIPTTEQAELNMYNPLPPSSGSEEVKTNASDIARVDFPQPENVDKKTDSKTENSNMIHQRDSQASNMATRPDDENNPTEAIFLNSSNDKFTVNSHVDAIDPEPANRETLAKAAIADDSTASPTTMNENTVTEEQQTETQTTDGSAEESGVYKLGGTTPGVGDGPQAAGDENNNKIYNVESITRGSLARTETTTPSAPLSAEETGGIGARIGIEAAPRAPAAVAEKQRTPKLEKASPIDKRLEILRQKVKPSKRETLRSWLQDPWLRAPAGLLLPLRARALSRALAVWTEVSEPEGLNLTEVILVGYDANGIGWLSSHNLQTSAGAKVVTEAIQKLLLKYQGAGERRGRGGEAALHACAWAARRVPYDSALFIVTDGAPGDARRLPAATAALIDKRLKLYTIWTDPLYPSAESARAVGELTKASQYTEGEFLGYHAAIATSDDADSGERRPWRRSDYRADETGPPSARAARLDNGIRERTETLLVRRTSGGSALGVPVEEGVSSLRVSIDGPVDRAVLYPPTGTQIDLFNATSVRGFAKGSHLESMSPLDAVLMFPEPDIDTGTSNRYAVLPPTALAAGKPPRGPSVGVWRLSVRCDACEYRVAITAQAPVGLDAAIVAEDLLRVRVRGPVASVRETTLVDEYGTELAKLPFSHQPSASEEGLDADVGDGSGLPALVADVPLPPVKRTGNVYARVVGRDIYGQPFARLAGPIFKPLETRMSRSAAIVFPDARSDALQSAVGFQDDRLDTPSTERSQRLFFGSTNNESTILPAASSTSQITSQAGTLLTTVQIGLSSRLYGTPGDNLQIHFEVSNYRERSVNFRFEASGNLQFLRGIRPTTQWISAGQTVNVIVDVGITRSAQIGARDLITFTATGLEQVSISAYVYVVNTELLVTDTWAPNVRHTFQGDCIGKQGDDCARHTWATTVYARDNDGGLLRLSSSPVGLRYESGFISGTRAEVTATYRATCCAPRLLVNAVDANGNANTYTVDISQYIPDAAIAAIVLGVLLLIALICLVVFLAYWCVRRRKESRQLPSYATPRRET